MLIWILIVLNIPVYLFIGWLAFDTTHDAAGTFRDTITALLKIIFIPWPIRLLLGMDDSDAVGILPIAGFLFACGIVVFGEYSLVQWLGWA